MPPCKCNRCHKDLSANPLDWQEHLAINYQAGYGAALGDGNVVQGRFCEACVKELLGQYLTVTQIDDPVCDSMAGRKLREFDEQTKNGGSCNVATPRGVQQ